MVQSCKSKRRGIEARLFKSDYFIFNLCFYSGPNFPTLATKLTRTQTYNTLISENTARRSLSTMDLTLLGLGPVLGIGLYVMTPKLMRDTAGPAIILSIGLASAAALLSGICYAEFSTRVFKCGSAYVYCYTTVGEIWAFIVGWTMILEYRLVGAVLARTCSEYVDFILGGAIFNFFKDKIACWDYAILGPFPDFLALILAIAMSVVVSLSTRCTMIFNRVVLLLTFIIFVLLFVISLFLVKPENWAHKFLPYGVQGVLRAASSGYYAFIGLDNIAAASAEVSYPQSSVPLSIVLTVAITTVIYVGLATVITLIAPYNQLSDLAPLAKIFEAIPGAQYVAAVGAVTCCMSVLVSCLIADTRVWYTMAKDGLLCMCCGCFSDSIRATEKSALVNGLISGVLATVFATEHLVCVFYSK